MKTGIKSSAYFGINDYEEGFLKVKADGYDCVDFQGFLEPDSPLYAMSENDLSEYLIKIKNSADKAGVIIWQMHGMWPHDDTTELSRKEVLARHERGIRACAKLGCKYFVVHPAMPNGWEVEKSREYAHEINTQRFNYLIDIAKQVGVVICLENMPFSNREHSFSSVSETIEFVRKFNSPNLKMCFDMGHCHVTRDNLYDSISLIGKDLKVLHVHDTKYGQDLHLIPYQGGHDWDEFVRALKDIDFDGCISLETNVGESTPQPIKRQMEKMLAKIARHIADMVATK